MLHLKRTHHLELPNLLPPSRLTLSPVTDDNDELLKAAQTERDDDIIRLEETPDVVGLDEFWNGVEADLKQDPTWFDFSND